MPVGHVALLVRAEDGGAPWSEHKWECICGESSHPCNPTDAAHLSEWICEHLNTYSANSAKKGTE